MPDASPGATATAIPSSSVPSSSVAIPSNNNTHNTSAPTTPSPSTVSAPATTAAATATARRSKPRRVIYKSTNLERTAPELVALASAENVSAVRAIQSANATAERVRDSYRSRRGNTANVGGTIVGSDEESNAKKYERRLQMNRQSAAASRVRREAYTKALEAELVNMEASYKQLFAVLAEQRRENSRLKVELDHTDPIEPPSAGAVTAPSDHFTAAQIEHGLTTTRDNGSTNNNIIDINGDIDNDHNMIQPTPKPLSTQLHQPQLAQAAIATQQNRAVGQPQSNKPLDRSAMLIELATGTSTAATTPTGMLPLPARKNGFETVPPAPSEKVELKSESVEVGATLPVPSATTSAVDALLAGTALATTAGALQAGVAGVSLGLDTTTRTTAQQNNIPSRPNDVRQQQYAPALPQPHLQQPAVRLVEAGDAAGLDLDAMGEQNDVLVSSELAQQLLLPENLPIPECFFETDVMGLPSLGGLNDDILPFQ